MNIGLKTKIESIVQNSQIDENEMVLRLKQLILENEKVAELEKKSLPISELIADTLNQIREGNVIKNYIPTQFSGFDETFGGIGLGELVVLGGRPSMGKTQWLVNLALNISINNPVLYISFDLSARILTHRFISCLSGIPVNKLLQQELNEDEKSALRNLENTLANHQIFINESGSNSTTALKTLCLKHISENGIKVIVIDYLQLMSSNKYSNNRETEISYIIRELKQLAKEFNVCVIVASQLSRAMESRGNNRLPILSDLRESGAIEQIADQVIFMYRPEYYNLHIDESGNSTANITELIVAKNKNGAVGNVRLYRNNQFTSFSQHNESMHSEFTFKTSRLFEMNEIDDRANPF